MARSKPTKTQRLIVAHYHEVGDVGAVALRLGISKGKVKNALAACGISRDPFLPEPVEKDPHDIETRYFKYTGDSTISSAWRDDTAADGKPVRNLWVKSNDGDLVCIPEQAIQSIQRLL